MTGDSVEHYESVHDLRDIVKYLFSPAIGDHDLFVPIYSISPIMDLSHDLLHRGYSSVPCVTHDFVDHCGSVRDTRGIIQDVFVSATHDHDVYVPVTACEFTR